MKERREERPTTPFVHTMAIRSSIPLTPFGIFVKSSFPSAAHTWREKDSERKGETVCVCECIGMCIYVK